MGEYGVMYTIGLEMGMAYIYGRACGHCPLQMLSFTTWTSVMSQQCTLPYEPVFDVTDNFVCILWMCCGQE